MITQQNLKSTFLSRSFQSKLFEVPKARKGFELFEELGNLSHHPPFDAS